MSNRSCRASLLVSLGLVGLSLVLSGRASADIITWNLLATCPKGKQEVKLAMSYSVADYWGKDPLSASKALYGCGGSCNGPHAIATSVSWQDRGTTCWCFPSGTEVTSASACPPNEYAKCTAHVEATLPYGCDQLAYTSICNSADCKAAGDMTYGPDGVCAELKPPASADQCLQAKAQVYPVSPGPSGPDGAAELDELGGCSVSTGAANASLLGLLLLVAGLSLLVARRRRR